MAEDLDHVLAATGGLVPLREHPHLRSVVGRRIGGDLHWLLPRVAGLATTPRLRVAAVAWWHPDAVVTGTAAAALAGLPGADALDALERVTTPVSLAVAGHPRPHPGYVLHRRRLDPDLVASIPLRAAAEPTRFTAPALTALDLIPDDGGALVCDGLRRGLFSHDELVAVLGELAPRRGDVLRRRVLAQTAAGPWSMLELAMHDLLREAGMTGWRANHPVDLGPDGHAVLDLAFEAERVAVELDGRATHATSTAFESDRARQNALVLAGWSVLRFTWHQVTHQARSVVTQVRTHLAARRAECATRPHRRAR